MHFIYSQESTVDSNSSVSNSTVKSSQDTASMRWRLPICLSEQVNSGPRLKGTEVLTCSAWRH